MRIALVDFISWDYTPATVYERPLGGSQSALCYLAAEWAAAGHEVYLINNARAPGVSHGVICVPLEKARPESWRAYDAVILLNAVKQGAAIRPLLRPGARLIGWLQHADDQPAVRGLSVPEFRDAFDAWAFVSQWQLDRFVERFSLDRAKCVVKRNAIGPAFRHRFSSGESVLVAKRRPWVLAYTSTPFRGLDLLVHLFPAIRAKVPGVTLRVFSSMGVYQTPTAEDESRYGSLYRQCRETKGIEYYGAVPQAELAERLRDVAVLAYPNHFAETSCIAVMEAMASGCWVLSSQLGALPETTAGFGTLLPPGENWLDYSDGYIEAAVELLERFDEQAAAIDERLQAQVQYVAREYDWRRRASEWLSWLAE